MDVITIESKAYAALVEKLDGIAGYVEEARRKEQEEAERLTAGNGNGRKKNEKWMLGEEVCEHLGISPRTLQRYRTQRIIPFSICGKKIKYLRRDVEQFIDRWMVSTTEQRVERMIKNHPFNRKKK